MSVILRIGFIFGLILARLAARPYTGRLTKRTGARSKLKYGRYEDPFPEPALI